MSIQAIDRASVHRLTSGQVVIDLQTAVKELLENALDARATSISIIFREYGVESFEVQDNGSGIEEADWNGLALKHHTSKLTSFDDLNSVSTLGFRGEALSSLCGTASLSIATATAATAPAGTQLTFKSSGECVVGSKIARGQGSTVVVRELFKTLPVRRKELIKNAKREFGKAIDLVQAYALISVGTRFEVKNVVKGKSSMQLQMPPNPNVRANFSAVFSPKSLASMMDLDLVLDVAADKSVLKWSESGSAGSTRIVVKGLVSKPSAGNGRTSSNRQFFYVNGRPFAPAKIAKAFNEIYKTYNVGSFPIVVADFQLPADAYDVNVSPDKRTIFLHSEGNMVSALKAALDEAFTPSRSTFLTTRDTASSSATPKDMPSREASPASAPRSTAASRRLEIDAIGSSGCQRSVSPDPAPSIEGDLDSRLSPPPSKRRRVDSAAGGSMSAPTKELSPSPPPSREATHSDMMDPTLSPGRQPSPDLANPAQDLSPRLRPARRSSVESRSPSPAAVKSYTQSTLKVTRSSWSLDDSIAATGAMPCFVAAARERRNETVKQRPSTAPDPDHAASARPNSTEASLDRVESPSLRAAVHDEAEEELSRDDRGLVAGRADESDDEIVVIDVAPSAHAALEGEDDDDLEILEEATSRLGRGGEERGEVISEVWGGQQLVDISLEHDATDIAAAWTAYPLPSLPPRHTSSTGHACVSGAGLEEDAQDAEAVLSRTVTKSDFSAMHIIGQFNHAFIVARKRSYDNVGDACLDDLFIIDQHASDEKYNFERMQAETVIQSQRLLQPRLLNLPSQDELAAIEHVELLRLNGFDILIDEDAKVGQRVKLVSQPVSKDTVFGVDDFEELLELADSISVGEVVRPSKVRRMFASRACRKSVMFGKALNLGQMSAILQHMGEMHQPWSCPHGRPTMRWLSGLSDTTLIDERSDIASVIARYAET